MWNPLLEEAYLWFSGGRGGFDKGGFFERKKRRGGRLPLWQKVIGRACMRKKGLSNTEGKED